MANKLYDVLIIGGGPAGLAVATGLVRQVHTALVLDSGVYRNALTHHMHNVPGYDHVDPAEFRAKARADLLRRYDTVQFQSATIKEVKKLDNGQFSARDEEGNLYQGRKLVLASGIRDVMPNIEGFGDCWARGIFHCLFCHGFEERGGESAGLLAIDMMSNPAIALHMGNMALQLARNLTIYTNGDENTAANITAAMKPASNRITIESRKIKTLAMASPNSDSADVIVTLADGTQKKESFIVSPSCTYLAKVNRSLISIS